MCAKSYRGELISQSRGIEREETERPTLSESISSWLPPGSKIFSRYFLPRAGSSGSGLKTVAYMSAAKTSEYVYLVEHGREHEEDGETRGDGEGDAPVVPGIVPARDVPERALARARLVALDEGDLLAQLVPEFGVVFGFCEG